MSDSVDEFLPRQNDGVGNGGTGVRLTMCGYELTISN